MPRSERQARRELERLDQTIEKLKEMEDELDSELVACAKRFERIAYRWRMIYQWEIFYAQTRKALRMADD